jgi:hypothetical protein
LTQPRNLRMCQLIVQIRVVGRQVPDSLEDLELHSGRDGGRRRPEQPGVVRATAQAAGDAEDPHHLASP